MMPHCLTGLTHWPDSVHWDTVGIASLIENNCSNQLTIKCWYVLMKRTGSMPVGAITTCWKSRQVWFLLSYNQ